VDRWVFRFLLLSQCSLFLFLAVCVAIVPHVLLARDEGGVSNYGIYGKTVVPFTIALVACGVFILMAAQIAPRTPTVLERFRCALQILGVLFLLLLTTTYPYKLNPMLKDVHVGVGSILFLFEMAMGIWIAVVLQRDWITVLLLLLQAIGFLLALSTLIGVLHILFISQIIASLAFGVLLVRMAFQLGSAELSA
jgi:hypothetical protein